MSDYQYLDHVLKIQRLSAEIQIIDLKLKAKKNKKVETLLD